MDWFLYDSDLRHERVKHLRWEAVKGHSKKYVTRKVAFSDPSPILLRPID